MYLLFEICDYPSVACVNGGIRLQDGSNVQGRVEVCESGVWKTICNESWDDRDAVVACSQLGLNSSMSMYSLLLLLAIASHTYH